jgi:hypothetical protein
VKPKKKLEDKLPYKDDFGSKYVLSGIEAAREIAAKRLRESAGGKRESVTAGGDRRNLRKL